MDKREFAIFADAIKTYFPKEKNLLPNNRAMELWFDQLCDIPYNVAQIVLKKWVAVSEWSPTIADIRKGAAEITSEPVKDWGEAWLEVKKQIQRYGHTNPRAALEALDETTAKVVRQLGYLNLCMSDNESVSRANFRNVYEREAERAEQSARLPQELKNLIGQMKVGAIEKKEAEA